MIELVNPSALWWLPLVAVLLLLARYRRPRQRRAVANLYLWRLTKPLDRSQMALVRLRRHWLVALQAAVMVAIIAALARPTLTWGARRVAFVFDVSASIGAREGGGSRLDAARARARAIQKGLRRGTRVRVIAAGTVPVTIGEFAANDSALGRTIEGLRPTGGKAAVADAVATARVADGSDVDVHVFSDGPALKLSDDGHLHWERVGAPADNVAITALAARRLPSAPADGQVLVEVRNFGSTARDVPIEVVQNGTVIARDTLHLAANSKSGPRGPDTGSNSFVARVRGVNGVISARIISDDALDVDNRRFAVVPRLDPILVLLQTRSAPGLFFLETALTTNPALAVDRERRHGVRYDVVVCDECHALLPGESGVLMIPSAAAAPSALWRARDALTPDTIS